jgi:hypothetical protein
MPDEEVTIPILRAGVFANGLFSSSFINVVNVYILQIVHIFRVHRRGTFV